MNKIVYEGLTYTARSSSPDEPSHWKDFGGRKFTIRFKDGNILYTDNLWCEFICKATDPSQDTCTIHEGWNLRPNVLNRCYWRRCGEYNVFTPR